MIRTSRLFIIGLLALMQMIAPLVHAHAGGGQSLGFVHVPGLEFLAEQSRDSVQCASQEAVQDVIVDLAQGLKLKSDLVAPASKLEYALPASAGLPLTRRVIPSGYFSADFPPTLIQQTFTSASPRAPPLIPSTF